jgi:hypothetical protein
VTTFVANQGGVLVSQFFQYVGGGPLTDLDAIPTISIIDLSTSSTILGPTTTNVLHPAVGTYTYAWNAPVAAGSYQAVWDGLYNSVAKQASELFAVSYSGTNSAGPCGPWEAINCDIPDGAGAISGVMIAAATEVLWAKSGRQFDACTMTLRPCRKDCFGGQWPFYDRWNEYGRSWPYPYNYAGQWFNLGCGGCPGSCSCNVLYEAKMPTPIASISEVIVDGVVLDPSAYKVYDRQMLLRVDGSPWPMCNNLNKDLTEVGTWGVTVTIGTEVPVIGRLAVGELASEFMKACLGMDCALTAPIQNLVRQGTSMTFFDPNVVFAAGKVGLYWPDLFISSFNPAGIAARAQVIDVDGAFARKQTWP